MNKTEPGTWYVGCEDDVEWWIKQKLYMCRVKYIDSISADYLKIFGMTSSGDSRSDQETANELVIRMLTITQMNEFFKNGITVHVVNYKDTKDIYERISNYLNGWKYKLANSFHIRDAPIEELLLLDRLASAVYTHAAPLFNTQEIDSLIARRAAGVMKFTRENILRPMMVSTTINPAKEEPPSRESMAETFLASANAINDLSKKWR